MIKINNLPLDDIFITSNFGLRNLTVNGTNYWWHNGIDLRAKQGTKVYAVADGTIRVAKDNPAGYGLYVVLDCGNFGILYAHLSEFYVKVGQKINSGDLIGLTGNSGASIAPHLHFEIRECEYKDFWTRCKTDRDVFMRCVDPTPYLEICKDRLNLTKDKAKKVIQEATGYSDETMKYLNSYIWRDDLILKMARAMM